MRQLQFRPVEDDIVIGDQIEIQRARAPAGFRAAIAAELFLDLVQRVQQRVRVEAGLDFDAGVDEAVLIFVAPGRGGVVGGARDEHGLRHAADVGDGLAEGLADVSDVAAERDQHAGHLDS